MALQYYRTFVYDNSRWDGFEFREGDIVISTPPKAGTTWTQRICAALVFGTAELEQPLSRLSPWLDMLTRFIKTHTPLDGLPWDERVTYICVGRDPRDIACSWDNHTDNLDVERFLKVREQATGSNADIQGIVDNGMPEKPPTPQERFWMWADDATPVNETPTSLANVFNHLATFWKERSRPNVVLLHYDDMKRDLDGQMRMLARRLAITIPEERWPELVEAATFERMKKDADKTAPNTSEAIWQSNENFFHRGTSGQWREFLAGDDRERYATRVREIADAELAHWAHHERLF
jgi:hypothetical protein